MIENEITNNIIELFNKWYRIIMFDSTGTWGRPEYKELTDYCKEHTEEFKSLMEYMLEHPDEHNGHIPILCTDVLPDIANIVDPPLSEQELITMIEKFKKISSIISNTVNSIFDSEYDIWEPCNKWLNYFKGTKNIDYYKNYREYKKYLKYNYIAWNPYKEEDPNPTYEQFIQNRSK